MRIPAANHFSHRIRGEEEGGKDSIGMSIMNVLGPTPNNNVIYFPPSQPWSL